MSCEVCGARTDECHVDCVRPGQMNVMWTVWCISCRANQE